MSDEGSVERRSRIDSETVKAVLFINGGMAAGLIAMLPVVLQQTAVKPLARYMIVAAACAAAGLVAIVVHSRLRRKCSLEYSKRAGRQGPYRSRIFVACQTVPNEPRVCTNSIIFFWLSVLLFCAGSLTVGIGAWILT